MNNKGDNLYTDKMTHKILKKKRENLHLGNVGQRITKYKRVQKRHITFVMKTEYKAKNKLRQEIVSFSN